MQRDMDLVRQILLAIEASPDPSLEHQPVISGWSDKDVSYHIVLLKQAALIDGLDTTVMGNPMPMYMLIGLTWSGHEFLAAARDESRWAKARAKLGGAFNTVTLGLLQEVLVSMAKSTAGLP